MNPSKPRRLYTPGFKAQAIELLAIGRPVTELAAELCISANLHYS
jgi:transposase-like protein